MNKSEMIEHIAQAADLSRMSAARALDAMIDAVATALRKDEPVAIAGLGSFYVGKREARSGRNPRTGETIEIKPARLPKFRPGKALRDALS